MSSTSTGPLARLAAWCVRRRGLVVALWIAAVVAVTGLASVGKGEFTADYTAQGSDSSAATALLHERFADRGGEQVDVLIRAEGGIESARPEVERLLASLAGEPVVTATASPWQEGCALSP